MPVDDENLIKAVVGDRLGDVEAKGDEDLGFDMDRPGKIDVVPVEPVGHRRQHQHPVWRPTADFEAHLLAQENVDVERQTSAMLLGGTRG